MNELVIINGKEVSTKEYNGERVVTAWDIAEVHGREVKKINQQFNRNIDKLIVGEDYFILNREEFSKSHKVTQNFIPNNVKELLLFTKTGYLMLVKTFEDDLSWKIQRELINNYFNKQENLPVNLNSLDVLKHVTNVLQDHDDKLNVLEYKVENKITLDSGEQRKVTKAVGNRVYERARQTGVPVKILFQALYRDLKDIFGVASYKDIKQKDLEDALKFISSWIETAEIRNNSQ